MPETLQILMPMGGLGQRFRDAGITTPKPLIEIDGTPMFQRALESFEPFKGSKKYIFVVRQDAENEYQLASNIKELQPDAEIVLMQTNTRGAVETCMLAEDLIDDSQPLSIMDCDFYFESRDYFGCLQEIADSKTYAGCLLTFKSQDPRYSYAKADSNGTITQTAEKVVISDNAIWGAYCFSSGHLYKQAARGLLSKRLDETMKEYYTSYLYNDLIAQGMSVKLTSVDYSESYGTPEELANSLTRLNRTDQ